MRAVRSDRLIIIANANGQGPRQLPQLTAKDTQPAFLPDGQTLVFAGRSKPRAPFDLYAVTSSATRLTRLTTTGAEPASGADGSIAFVRGGNIYLLSADRRTQRRLTARGGDPPDCSPDGRSVAYIHDGNVYVVTSNGARVRRLTTRHKITSSYTLSNSSQQTPGLDTSRPAFSPHRPADRDRRHARLLSVHRPAPRRGLLSEE